MNPLADYIRPKSLDDVVGQTHILGENGLLRRVVENSDNLPNMIFYGPPGIGKTTVADILAQKTKKRLCKLNATTAGISDIRAVIDELDTLIAPNGVLLYLDEIQYFNKKQQQSLLDFIESGKITLIASTTENPYFYVYPAILSRSTVFEFKSLAAQDIVPVVKRAIAAVSERLEKTLTADDDCILLIAQYCGGDVRKSINTVELLAMASTDGTINADDIRTAGQRSSMRYDREGDEHYDILSAFQKSIRGSDENAALHYMSRLVEAGDLPSLCRRLLVTAAEDIGLAYPMAIPIVKACVDAALHVGLPEAAIPLSDAIILLCTAPKSNSGVSAMGAAMSRLRQVGACEIPAHLKDGHYSGAEKMGRGVEYKYPHSYPNGYIEQQYLPDAIKDDIYYNFGENKTEQAAKQNREKLL